MDYAALEKSVLFSGIPAKELREALEAVPYHIRSYDRAEIVFHQMENANRIGILLEGSVQAQKPFPNGSQVNVSVRRPGEIIGAAAAFSKGQKYPCDIAALEPSTILMFRREDVLLLLQKDVRIMNHLMTELATAAYMLQQRLELLSYSGIAQKAACYLLMQARQSGRRTVRIPGSISNWAMVMNVSRPSLHRELRAMEEKGFTRIKSHEIEILNPDGLQKLLEQQKAKDEIIYPE